MYAQPNPNAGEYLGRIGEQFGEISKDLMSYSSATAHGRGARKVEKKRQELIGTLKQAEFNVRKLRPFNENSQLRDTVASYLHLSRIVLTEDFGKIINLEDVAEQSYDAMEAYLLAKELAYDKLDQSFDRVKEQQKAFAQKYEIKLIENESELSRKLEKAGQVNSYYNQVYLVFSKALKMKPTWWKPSARAMWMLWSKPKCFGRQFGRGIEKAYADWRVQLRCNIKNRL